MANQSDITPRMRAILVDWLVEVHMKFKLIPSTLYLCVHLIDVYCAGNDVQRSRLQLVGITALLVASKYEEIYPPEVRFRFRALSLFLPLIPCLSFPSQQSPCVHGVPGLIDTRLRVPCLYHY